MTVLLATLGIFVLILVLARLRVPLGIAIFSGSIVLGLVLGLDGAALLRAVRDGVATPQAFILTAVTILLLGLSFLMRESGQLEEIVSLAHLVLRRPVATMVAMPALIGLLPMPGGAIFSAPMVEAAGGETELSKGFLSYVNYWFRHIWEYFWPLYPGVILAMTLTGFDIPSWTLLMIFMTISMIVGGLLPLRGMHPDLRVKSTPPPIGTKRKLLKATGPIWMILLTWFLAHIVLEFWSVTHPAWKMPNVLQQQGPLLVGLVASIGFTIARCKLGMQQVRKAFCQPSAYSMAGLILAILIFQRLLDVTQAPQLIAGELQDVHVPLAIVVAILPFIAGFITGIAVGFVGTAFPIVLNIVGAAETPGHVIAYIPLAYAFGHLGQMISPLHVCQVVSNRYFGTTYGPVYKYLIPACLSTAVLAVGYFLFLRWLL